VNSNIQNLCKGNEAMEQSTEYFTDLSKLNLPMVDQF
jgi:hypothetical protein